MRTSIFNYLFGRIFQYWLVIVLGVTLTFFIPRLSPVDPVEAQISRIMASGSMVDPDAIIEMRDSLTELYGLGGSTMQQYFAFWGRLMRGDLGPSLAYFPTPVSELLARAMPWTFGLLMTSIMISWIIGNVLGAMASYYEDNTPVKILDVFSQAVRPIPYYIMALVLLVVFAYYIPIFPFSGAYPPGTRIEPTLHFALTVLYHSMLPLLSLVLIGVGGWFIGMKSLTSNIISEDYVVYAENTGLRKNKILNQYIMRNAMLPQITGLALQIGLIFGGALIMEVVFGYPGMGWLTFQAVLANDYTLIMGITLLSIIGVATMVLILDLIYPLFDPRVRYQ